MVKNAANMRDLSRLFAGAKGQIMILTAIAFRPQSPYPLHQRLFHGHQVADIISRPQGIRGKIAFQVRIKKVRTIRAAFILIGIYHIRALFRSVKHTIGRVRGQQIVMIYQRYPIVPRHDQRTIRVPGNAKVFRAKLYTNARIAGRLRLQRLAGVLAWTASVIKTGLPRVGGLRQQGVHQRRQQRGLRIIGRDQKGQAVGKGGIVLTLALRRVRLLRHEPRVVARFVPRTCGAVRLLCIAGLKNSEFCIGIMRYGPQSLAAYQLHCVLSHALQRHKATSLSYAV